MVTRELDFAYDEPTLEEAINAFEFRHPGVRVRVYREECVCGCGWPAVQLRGRRRVVAGVIREAWDCGDDDETERTVEWAIEGRKWWHWW